MKNVRAFALGGAALLVAMAIGALATWVVLQQIDIGGNQVSTAHPYVAHLTANPTEAVWPPLVDAEPGSMSGGILSLSNEGTDDVHFQVTTNNTNPSLAEQLELQILDHGCGTGGYDGPLANLNITGAVGAGAGCGLEMYVMVPDDLDPAFGDQTNVTTFHIEATPAP